MRYFLHIDLNKKVNQRYSFENTEIKKHLPIETMLNPEPYISLTTLRYDRVKPGLIETNWETPFYNDAEYFIFLAGSVLFRNKYKKDKPVPTPYEVLKIILDKNDDHYNVIKGNYYIVFLSKADMKVKVYSSPMFMHPAFYSFHKNQFLFSNYLESFRSFLPLTIDQQGLVEFSLFDHSIHNRTIYNEIKNVPGGYLFEFQNGIVTEKLCYDIANWFTSKPRKRKESLYDINLALKSIIGNYIDSTDKFNTSLTGGFDGRLNFSFIKKEDYPRLRAMSYGMSGSKELSVPKHISEELGFNYRSVLLDEDFENVYSEMGLTSINLTCGVTGFNRAMYPYAYNIIKDFSRSCIIGQCDMIRPLYKRMAGVIYNEFSKTIFFSDYNTFKQFVLDFSEKAFIKKDFFSDKIIQNIYDEIRAKYILNYPALNNKLQFYFFLLKESLMKYWHTEFHLVDIFVDDYVSFADLDYLELLFNSEYAGIYKGLLAGNQFGRMKAQDLYVDLMEINNSKLNNFNLDRGFKPKWLKYGSSGWILAAIVKNITKFKNRAGCNDTFNASKWSKIFLTQYKDLILKESKIFNLKNIKTYFNENNFDADFSYRFNRAVSLKIWLEKINLI